MINQTINKLIKYGLSKDLLTKDDQEYVLTRLGKLLNLEEVYIENTEEMLIKDILDVLINYAIEKNIISDNTVEKKTDFEARLMDCLMPRPSELNKLFRAKYKKSPQQATNFFNNFSYDSCYVKSKALEDNLNYLYDSQYGDLEMIVNSFSSDPLHVKQVLGGVNHRKVAISVNNEKNAWEMQFMPYPLFEEQCLISRKDHLKPYNNDKTFEELIDFINKFPQYFIMSDLSKNMSTTGILPYHYFQAGKHVFPIESAEVIGRYKNSRVRIEVLKWPVSAIRLIGNNENKLLDVMHDIHQNWTKYSDDSLKIKAETDGLIHNIIDVFVKLDGSKFNVYMVLKNNRKTEDYPQGIFQPDKDQIFSDFGIMEDLGSFEIPKSLHNDLSLVKNMLLEESDLSKYPNLKYLKNWIDSIKDIERPDDLDLFLINQLGKLFEKCLKETNVFKFGEKEDFIAFIEKAV